MLSVNASFLCWVKHGFAVFSIPIIAKNICNDTRQIKLQIGPAGAIAIANLLPSADVCSFQSVWTPSADLGWRVGSWNFKR